MALNFTSLRDKAVEIKNEIRSSMNSSSRVGILFGDMIDKIEEAFTSLGQKLNLSAVVNQLSDSTENVPSVKLVKDNLAQLERDLDERIHQTDDGEFSIEDEAGNKAIIIDKRGVTQKMQFSDEFSFNGVSNSTTDDGEFSIEDEAGNKAFGIAKKGSVFFDKITTSTINYLNSILNGSIVEQSARIKNKKVSILGDSISTDMGGGNANLVYPQQYWGKLEQLQGCTTYRNAIGGTTIAQGGQGTPFVNDTRWQSLNSQFTPDVILVFGGINDFLQKMPIGSNSDVVKTTFYGALDYLYKSLLSTNKGTQILHMTPLHTIYSQGGGLIPEYNGVNYLSEYINAIYEVARRYGVGVIDTNRDSGISCYNITLLSDDKIHPKELGHTMIYNSIINYTNLLLTL